ncbi:hypothetical protein F4824DRAFT_403489 [Ustulina deusta]|nr:hypothetical protein F4824DRAFT_403489 [Ustulina deusta]
MATQAFSPDEAYFVQDFSQLTHPYIHTQLDSTIPFSSPNVAASPSSPAIKMRASPQRPGPSGSRVVKKRSSIPRLGDRLPAVFVHDATLANSTAHTKSEASTTLTSSNLSRLAKNTRSGNDFALVDTLSVCSDEDVILIGTPHRSINSKSSSRLSSRSGTPRGDETPPTTLTGDDSFFSSDGETTPILSTPVNGKTSFSSTLAPTYGLEDLDSLEASTARAKCPSPITISFSKMDGTTNSSHHIAYHPANKPSESFEPTPFHTTARTIAANGVIPDAESLHGIIRGFLTAETKAKSISPSTTEPGEPPTFTPTTPNKAKPFWEPQRIFEFYIKGAITPEKAKETAKRYGYPDAIPIIDEIEGLKKTNPSLPVSEIITTAAKEGNLGGFIQLPDVSAVTPQRDQYNTTHDKFMLKLATCSAKDGLTGSAKPLHIFVDMSNIHIGFCNSWKISQNIPVDHRIRAPAFNFKVLASIMERNRVVKKKVLASSVASHVVSRAQWPQHFIDAEQQGYKTSILSRVQKVSPIKAGRRRKASPQGSGVAHLSTTITSGDESAEEMARISYETRNGEQGVDEILHLNMMNSILDDMREPSSMILATGDAAQAEFSEGFLEYATRALSQGWNLELVTWKRTISSAWIDPVFRNKFEERFRIVYLDDFLEELNADLCPSLA